MASRFIPLLTALALACCCTTQSGGRGSAANNNANDKPNPNDNSTTVERFTLVADTVGGGSVEPSAGTFETGEEVTLTATPDEGWRFDRWEGDATSTDPVITVSVVKDTSLTAFFVKVPLPPPDNANDNGDGSANDNTDGGVQPGDDFETAPLVQLDADGRFVADETILRATDLHVYDVGPLALGDLFTATCDLNNGFSSLDPMMALFDADGYRVFWNDDVDLEDGDFSALVSGLIRHDSPHYYIVVTSTDFAETTGDYQLTIEVLRGAGAPAISGHTVVIDFDGAANVVVADQDWGSPAPFEAGNIDSDFAGQTETLKQTILSVVRADFAAFDLTVLSTDDPAPAGPVTTAFMGEDDDQLLGIADDLDFYNARHDDNVIIFAEAFGGLTNSLDEMGLAIGNVVSHEIGHSLGLMHTLDVTELMDNSGQDLPLLDDQSFGVAPVFDFPIGLQNAPLLLSESLGAAAKRIPARPSGLRCGTCGLPLEKIARR